MKSHPQDSESGQPVSFGEILKIREKQLQAEQEINASSVAVALAGIQIPSIRLPMLDLGRGDGSEKVDAQTDLQLETSEPRSSIAGMGPPTVLAIPDVAAAPTPPIKFSGSGSLTAIPAGTVLNSIPKNMNRATLPNGNEEATQELTSPKLAAETLSRHVAKRSGNMTGGAKTLESPGNPMKPAVETKMNTLDRPVSNTKVFRPAAGIVEATETIGTESSTARPTPPHRAQSLIREDAAADKQVETPPNNLDSQTAARVIEDTAPVAPETTARSSNIPVSLSNTELGVEPSSVSTQSQPLPDSAPIPTSAEYEQSLFDADALIDKSNSFDEVQQIEDQGSETNNPPAATILKSGHVPSDEGPVSFGQNTVVADTPKAPRQRTLPAEETSVAAHPFVNNHDTAWTQVDAEDASVETKKAEMPVGVTVANSEEARIHQTVTPNRQTSGSELPISNTRIDYETSEVFTKPVAKVEEFASVPNPTPAENLRSEPEGKRKSVIVTEQKVEQQAAVSELSLENLPPANQTGDRLTDSQVSDRVSIDNARAKHAQPDTNENKLSSTSLTGIQVNGNHDNVERQTMDTTDAENSQSSTQQYSIPEKKPAEQKVSESQPNSAKLQSLPYGVESSGDPIINIQVSSEADNQRAAAELENQAFVSEEEIVVGEDRSIIDPASVQKGIDQKGLKVDARATAQATTTRPQIEIAAQSTANSIEQSSSGEIQTASLEYIETDTPPSGKSTPALAQGRETLTTETRSVFTQPAFNSDMPTRAQDQVLVEGLPIPHTASHEKIAAETSQIDDSIADARAFSDNQRPAVQLEKSSSNRSVLPEVLIRDEPDASITQPTSDIHSASPETVHFKTDQQMVEQQTSVAPDAEIESSQPPALAPAIDLKSKNRNSTSQDSDPSKIVADIIANSLDSTPSGAVQFVTTEQDNALATETAQQSVAPEILVKENTYAAFHTGESIANFVDHVDVQMHAETKTGITATVASSEMPTVSSAEAMAGASLGPIDIKMENVTVETNQAISQGEKLGLVVETVEVDIDGSVVPQAHTETNNEHPTKALQSAVARNAETETAAADEQIEIGSRPANQTNVVRATVSQPESDIQPEQAIQSQNTITVESKDVEFQPGQQKAVADVSQLDSNIQATPVPSPYQSSEYETETKSLKIQSAAPQTEVPATNTSDLPKVVSSQTGANLGTPTTEVQNDAEQIHATPTVVSEADFESTTKIDSSTGTDSGVGTYRQSVSSTRSALGSQVFQTVPANAEKKIYETSFPAAETGSAETSVSPGSDTSTKVDHGKEGLDADKSYSADEKISPIENQRLSTETIEQAAMATNFPRETVVSHSERGSAIEIDPHAVEVVEQVIHQLNGRLKSGPTSMHLHLNPEEWGAIEVEMTRDSNGVSVTFFAEQVSTGKLLETQLSQLRQSLIDSGVQLSGLNIGQHSHSRQEGGFPNQNTNFAQDASRQPEALQSKVNTKEDPGPEPYTGQMSEVDYLI